MVKITNEFGDKYTGKQGEAIYQKHYGTQIRRKAYKEDKEPSKRQIQVRNNFKDATSWVKSLSYEQREDLKKFYKTSKISYSNGYPVNWYNFAKWIYIKKPEFQILDSETNDYQIDHPSIVSIKEMDEYGFVHFYESNISTFQDLNLNKKYIKTPTPYTTKIIVTLLTGLIYEYIITSTITSLIYCDIKYCNPLYCK